jgi:DNA ligase-1
VGSGMDNQQRLEWFKNPNLIIGKEVTIQFFEETVDDKGSLSLRFPTIKYIYENKRDL